MAREKRVIIIKNKNSRSTHLESILKNDQNINLVACISFVSKEQLLEQIKNDIDVLLLYDLKFKIIDEISNLFRFKKFSIISINNFDENNSSDLLFKKLLSDFKSSQEEIVETPLTDMEIRVAKELIKDKTNQQIADSLCISKRTVEYHITSSIQKLGVKSRVGLAVKMMEKLLG